MYFIAVVFRQKNNFPATDERNFKSKHTVFENISMTVQYVVHTRH